MINLLRRISDFFTRGESEFTEEDLQGQAVFYSDGGDTYINLDTPVKTVFQEFRSPFRTYGTTIVNGRIYFCIQLIGGAWRVLDPEESKELGRKIMEKNSKV